jgi:hypothetical protein
VGFGFRFLLIHPDGAPVDPAAFLPNWRTGDEFLAGSDLQKFRVGAVSEEEPPPESDGLLVVEAVEG